MRTYYELRGGKGISQPAWRVPGQVRLYALRFPSRKGGVLARQVTSPRAKAFVAGRGYTWDEDRNSVSAMCSAAALAASKLSAVPLATKVGKAFFPMDR